MDFAVSVNKHKVRLTNERWKHITEGHQEMAGYYFEILETVSNPDYIYEGLLLELLAVQLVSLDKYMVVIIENQKVLTDLLLLLSFTTKLSNLKNKKLIWEKNK